MGVILPPQKAKDCFKGQKNLRYYNDQGQNFLKFPWNKGWGGNEKSLRNTDLKAVALQKAGRA